MTVTSTDAETPAKQPDLVTLTIDGFEVSVPEGTLLIRAAEMIGVQIPRFCDHPLLEPVGACRQCLVEIPDAGNGRAMPKPQASCTIAVAPGMVVKTQLTSPVADKAQQGMMEFLLINHPLDCPVCDKGGECPLQNQAMSNGRGESRYEAKKRTYPKPINISAQVLLDRDRCVLCARCTRFQDEIAGDPFIEMLERGALQQVGIYEAEPFESYFSGNTIQICPVGALTSAAYRFRARPFDLISVPTTCEHCASGCSLRTDIRRGTVMRRLAGDEPEVNEEWNCDRGRFAFRYADLDDRVTHPLVRDEDTGELVTASWPEALDIAARGLSAAREGNGVGVLTGGRLTQEDAYAYAKFARVAAYTNDVDFRARSHSAEEAAFLAGVAATRPGTGGVTYRDLEGAPLVLMVDFEPEDESPIVFLRLRKAARKNRTRVVSLAPFASRGLTKVAGELIPTAPGTEAEVLDAIAAGDQQVEKTIPGLADALRQPGAVILVGERAAGAPGTLSAVHRLATGTGARLAWIPRRAGERGALDAGALPSMLPGGRPVNDAEARVDVAATWGVSSLPATEGRDTAEIVAAAGRGDLDALLVGGVDPADLPDASATLDAIEAAGFVLSLEVRRSSVTERADVVLPVVPVTDKGGTFVDWEGRERPFPAVRTDAGGMPDGRVLHAVAQQMGYPIGLRSTEAARTELEELGTWDGIRPPAPSVPSGELPEPGRVQAVLAGWRLNLDHGRLQDGEPFLAQTARAPILRLSATTAGDIGVADGETVTVSTRQGAIALPLVVTDMPDRVVWVPLNSPGSHVHEALGVDLGAVVELSRGGGE